MNKRKAKSRRNGQNSNDIGISAAKLAVIAGAVSTFGDVLATIAAALALEDGLDEDDGDDQTEQNLQMQEEKIASMQKQIDELTLQIKNLTKK